MNAVPSQITVLVNIKQISHHIFNSEDKKCHMEYDTLFARLTCYAQLGTKICTSCFKVVFLLITEC